MPVLGSQAPSAPPVLRPLAEWPAHERAGIWGLCTDIDDTLTTAGAITPDALAALADLCAAGLVVLAITGRPVGWAQARARDWPVHAVVAENGAVALCPPSAISIGGGMENGQKPKPSGHQPLQKAYQHDAPTRAAEARRLHAAAQRVLREVPGAVLADSAGRETDIAFDFAEHTQLPPATVDAMEALLRAEGLHTTRSSIHLHGAVSARDKWTGACWAARTLLGRDLPAEIDHWVAVGDSGNDEAMFRHFRHSVGVANIRHCHPPLAHWPRWVTQAERGAGFAELARALLQERTRATDPCPARR